MQALIVERKGQTVQVLELPGRTPITAARVPPAARERVKEILQAEGDLRVVLIL